MAEVVAAHRLHLPSLTGLRAAAALAVFVSHSRWLLPLVVVAEEGSRRLTSDNILFFGAQGVSLFFVLSGFVLTWSAQGPTRFVPFMQRRFARVWPAHATLWAVFMVLGFVGITRATAPAPAIANLALVQTWVPGLGWATSVNPLAWTLSCEAFFYMIFPFAYRIIRQLASSALLLLALLVIASGLLVNWLYLVPAGTVVSTFPPFRLWEFLLGAIVATAIQRGWLRTMPPPTLVLSLLIAALLAARWIPSLEALSSTIPALCFAVLIGSLARRDTERTDRPVHRSWLEQPFVQYCGQLSFGFYLVQLLTLRLVRYTFGDPHGLWMRAFEIAMWFALTALLAAALFHGVERPAHRRLLQRFSPPRVA